MLKNIFETEFYYSLVENFKRVLHIYFFLSIGISIGKYCADIKLEICGKPNEDWTRK